MKITIHVVGLGFVGLTTALAFAKAKFNVFGIENDENKLRLIKRNIVPFHEPFLKERLIIEKNRSFLKFKKNIELDKTKRNIVIVCVGTPAKKNGEANLDQINKIIEDLNQKYERNKILADDGFGESSLTKEKGTFKDEKIVLNIKSTVPPGSCFLLRKKANKNISLASNPEFLREGFAWKDFSKSGRIILGHEDNFSKKILLKIYKKFKDEKILVNNTTAEFIKYLSNVFLANLISFSNDLAIFAENFKNINVKTSFDALKLDRRWNGYPADMTSYLRPGIGYGGYCLPKDTRALSHIMKKFKKDNIVQKIDKINSEITSHQAKKIMKLKTKKIFILGLSFGVNTDDIRESRSILLIKKLLKYKKKIIYASDPLCSGAASAIFKNKVKIYNKPMIQDDTTYILATPWKEYIVFLKGIHKDKILDLRYMV